MVAKVEVGVPCFESLEQSGYGTRELALILGRLHACEISTNYGYT